MAFEFINYSEYNTSWNSTIVVQKPTDTDDWDIMFALLYSETRTIISIPSWWTLIWTTLVVWRYFHLYYKVASSEWTSYTWTLSWTWKARWLWLSYRWWFNTADPIDVISDTVYDTNNTTIRAASMTVSAKDSPLLIFSSFYSISSTTFTKPSVPTTDWVEDYDWGNMSPDIRNEICSMVWTSDWSTWDMDITASSSVDRKHAFAVALNPEATWINKIQLWATEIQSIKLGSTDISKIYLWSTEVFSK